MKRIYALFSNTDGHGFESTFICIVKETELKFVSIQLNNVQINKTAFKIGYCDIVGDESAGPWTREWTIPEMNNTVLTCKESVIYDAKK